MRDHGCNCDICLDNPAVYMHHTADGDGAYACRECVESMMLDSVVFAACEDQCEVEPDGFCEHGNPSWLLVAELI